MSRQIHAKVFWLVRLQDESGTYYLDGFRDRGRSAINNPLALSPVWKSDFREVDPFIRRERAIKSELLETLRYCEKWFERFAPTADLIGGKQAELPMLTSARNAIAKAQGTAEGCA